LTLKIAFKAFFWGGFLANVLIIKKILRPDPKIRLQNPPDPKIQPTPKSDPKIENRRGVDRECLLWYMIVNQKMSLFSGRSAMAHLIIGSLLTALLILLILHARRKHVRISWWQWTLILLELVYAGFVLEVIVAFLEEGAGRAALVMGLVLGFIAVVGAVLLGRFVVFRKSKSSPSKP